MITDSLGCLLNSLLDGLLGVNTPRPLELIPVLALRVGDPHAVLADRFGLITLHGRISPRLVTTNTLSGGEGLPLSSRQGNERMGLYPDLLGSTFVAAPTGKTARSKRHLRVPMTN